MDDDVPAAMAGGVADAPVMAHAAAPEMAERRVTALPPASAAACTAPMRRRNIGSADTQDYTNKGPSRRPSQSIFPPRLHAEITCMHVMCDAYEHLVATSCNEVRPELFVRTPKLYETGVDTEEVCCGKNAVQILGITPARHNAFSFNLAS